MKYIEYLDKVWAARNADDLRVVESMASVNNEIPKLMFVYEALGINASDPGGVYGKMDSLNVARTNKMYQAAKDKIETVEPSKSKLPWILAGTATLLGVIFIAKRNK